MHKATVKIGFAETTCRVLAISEEIDTQTNDQQFVQEGFEVPAQTLIIFTCVKKGRKVIGPNAVTCLLNGTWSSPYPTECGNYQYRFKQYQLNV